MDAGIAGAGYPDTAKSSAYGWASVRIGDNGELSVFCVSRETEGACIYHLLDDHVADGWIWLSAIMTPSELLRALHEANQALQWKLEQLRRVELRGWMMTEKLEAELRARELEDENDQAEYRDEMSIGGRPFKR